jgi:hypothetical protein
LGGGDFAGAILAKKNIQEPRVVVLKFFCLVGLVCLGDVIISKSSRVVTQFGVCERKFLGVKNAIPIDIKEFEGGAYISAGSGEDGEKEAEVIVGDETILSNSIEDAVMDRGLLEVIQNIGILHMKIYKHRLRTL